MGRFDAKTSMKGQATIPIEVRKALGLPPGGAVQLIIGDDGKVILDDDPDWSSPSTEFIDTQLSPDRPGYISIITLVELVWVLRREPRYDRARLALIIESLLDSDSLVLAEATAVERALMTFKTGKTGFADYLIAELNEAAGASPTITFDRKSGKTFPFTPLSHGA